jgi:hypothetical protein
MKAIDLLLERRLPLKLKSVILTINQQELESMKAFAEQRNLSFRFDALINPRLDGVLKNGEKTFDSGGIWQLYQNNGNNIITLESPTLGKEPYEVAFLTKNFTGGDIYINEEISLKSQLHYPLTYSLDELLMINLLCQGRGIEAHAYGGY